jgi:hypothetical protein
MDQIPETLKTGWSADVPDVQLDATKKRLLATVTVMTQKAGIMAFQYAVHNGRSQEDHHDVCMALKHQARTFLQTVDQPDVVEDILEMEKLMYGSDTDDTDDTDMSDTAQSEFRQDFSQTQKLEGGTCVCDECIEMRNAVATWDDWAPEDEAEMYLKQRVTSAVSILPVEEGG